MHDPTLAARIRFCNICCDLKDEYYCIYKHPLTDEEVKEFAALTHFVGHEVIEAFDLFAFYARDLEIPPSTSRAMENYRMFRRVRSIYVCPWSDRLEKIFSSDKTHMSYTDWMDMYNAYHWRTPVEYKIEVAFRIYDFDNDGYISHEDVVQYLKRSTDGVLQDIEYEVVAEEIVMYYDLDKDGLIGFMDFKLGMAKDLDFGDKFYMSIFLNRDLRWF